jgi:hypothetical protein
LEDGEEIDFGGGPIVDEEFFPAVPVFLGDVLAEFHEVIAGAFVGFGVSRIGDGLEAHIGTYGLSIGFFGRVL